MSADAPEAPPAKAPGDAPPGETRELRILYQMSTALGRSLQIGDLLADALETIEALLALPLSAIYLFESEADGGSFRLRAHRGFSSKFDVDRLPYDISAPWFQPVMNDVRPYVAREPIAAPPDRVSERGKREGVQSWAMIPLVSRGHVLGVLLVASRALDKLDGEEVELLETLAPDLGVAIENATLFELVQRGRDEWLHTFDSVEDRLAVLDSERKVVRANRALIDALGRPPAEIIGKNCSELFPAICADRCPHREALTGVRIEREVNEHGNIFQVTVYPTPTGGVIHVAKDVTLERQRERQLVQAEKLSAASAVLAGVAHELNNPLTVVIAYADLLTQLEDSGRFREEVQQILRSALRCQSIVRNLLGFSRQDKPARVEVDVNQLVRETIQLFSYQLRVAGIRVEERLSPTVPTIAGDRARLQVILVNLLSNASHALKRGAGYLRIATRTRDGRIEIEVRDDGSGIAPEVLARVFEPFFTTKEPGEGTGLGLSLSLTVARDHGGDITIDSQCGRGTTVLVSLPIGTAAAPAEPEPTPAEGCLAGRRILVVDDEPDVRSLVAAALDLYGAVVQSADNGVSALTLLRNDAPFDLVFTDLRMPEMGGDQLIAAIRREHPALAERVLLTTGDVATPSAEAAIRRSGRPCLAKPFNIRQLIAAIVRVLADTADPKTSDP